MGALDGDVDALPVIGLRSVLDSAVPCIAPLARAPHPAMTVMQAMLRIAVLIGGSPGSRLRQIHLGFAPRDARINDGILALLYERGEADDEGKALRFSDPWNNGEPGSAHAT